MVVAVPVNVVAGGEPVRGLTAQNFEIYEGKRLLPLVGFEVVDLENVGADSAPGGEPDREGLSQLFFGLDTEQLTPDTYSLEISLIDRETGTTVSSSTSFEVRDSAVP